ncbi:MAG: nicotinamide mononucleotide transporter [Cyclobacteriaceae bacterium]|nr:MAG: nicotinamide mononucleotide transporter [Cyclobacteriaceae bacterium]
MLISSILISVMESSGFFQEVLNYATGIKILEFTGLIFGLLCVWFLIRQNILTWPAGILYVLISFVIFLRAKLYADFILHVFFLVLNIYGWYYWKNPGNESDQVEVTTSSPRLLGLLLLLSTITIYVSGRLLVAYTDASLPYWDSTTSILSIVAMWLTAKKKIENWIFWLAVDVLATGIYYYKGIYFYCILYLVYIGMAVVGYLAWHKSMNLSIER